MDSGDDVLRTGVIIMEEPRPRNDGMVNYVYEYGNPTFATMSLSSYLRTKPISGHLRDRNSFPLGQRILFKRNAKNEASEAIDEGGFNFNEVRCVRGVGLNAHLCFVDLLEAVIDIGEAAMDVPPGVQFVAQLNIKINERKQEVKFALARFIELCYEDLRLYRCPWPVVFAPYLLDEPDYSRKKQTVTVFPQFDIEYIGDTDKTKRFRIMKEPKDYSSSKHSNIAVFGPSAVQLPLKQGALYTARIVFSRFDDSIYTTHVEPWTNRSYIPENEGVKYARSGK